MSFKSQVKEITPDYAQKLLDANKDNRKVSWDRVNHYVREMASGNWELNGQPIVVAESGRLLDGQHRLYACVQSRTPFTTLLVTGVSEDSMSTLDTGKSRRAPDILSILGFKDVNHVAAVSNLAMAYENGSLQAAFSSWGRYEPREIAEYAQNNPSICDWSRIGHANAVGIGCVTIAATVGFLLEKHSKVRNVVPAYTEFLEKVASGLELTNDSPIYHLRKRLEKGVNYTRPSSRREVAALFIKAWNAYYGKQKMNTLRFMKTEEFPQIATIEQEVEA